MRKKLFAAAAMTLALTFSASALLPGEQSTETKYRLEWINCSPMPLGKVDPETQVSIPALRGVVFFYTRDDAGDPLFRLLENARRSFGGKVLIAVITPDDTTDATEFQKRHKESRLRLAVDLERKLTPHFLQGGNLILPAGFLLDADGQVLWRGEAADLPEAADLALSGKLDVGIQRKTAPLLDRIQQALRNGNMPLILRTAEQMFAIDPGNPAAVRMSVFAAESMRDPMLAWKIVERQKQAAPGVARLNFTALELILRHNELRDKLPGLIADFLKSQPSASLRYAFADALLRNFPYDGAAIVGAKKLIESAALGVNAAPEEMAMVLALKARLRYALGDLAGAEELQREAVQFYSRTGDKPGLDDARKMLDFFRTLTKEAQTK